MIPRGGGQPRDHPPGRATKPAGNLLTAPRATYRRRLGQPAGGASDNLVTAPRATLPASHPSASPEQATRQPQDDSEQATRDAIRADRPGTRISGMSRVLVARNLPLP